MLVCGPKFHFLFPKLNSFDPEGSEVGVVEAGEWGSWREKTK